MLIDCRESLDVTPSAINEHETDQALKAIGVPFDPTSRYVVAVVQALDKSQALLFDYTSVGDISRVKGHDEPVDKIDNVSPVIDVSLEDDVGSHTRAMEEEKEI